MSPHPFTKKKEARFVQEVTQKVFLRLATYAILFFTLFVFWEIIAKGVPVLKQYGLDFVMRKPETLEVVSFDAAKNLQIPQKSFKTLQTYNPDETLFTEVKETSRSFGYRDFKIRPSSYISDGYLSQIEKHNPNFRAGYKSRSQSSLVAFTTTEEQSIIIPRELYSKLQEIPEIADLPVNELELETRSYPVTFREKECQMQAKTIVALSGSDLIYKLYGNLTDTADDNPTELMKLYIPREQTVNLSSAQYAAYDSDSGTAKFGEAEAVITKIQKSSFSLPAGQHKLPFNLFSEISAKALSFNASHQHNLDRGVIELDLKKETSLLRLPLEEFETMKRDNPALILSDISPVQVKEPYIEFNLSRASEVKLPTTDMSAFRMANKDVEDANGQPLLNVLNEHVYPYSGGGISGPVIGTALLVLTCMLIGLVIGVSAAVFLGEYSKKGKVIYLIRLSMMNLAGVPSIVFGIFGLGLFVSLAPLTINQ